MKTLKLALIGFGNSAQAFAKLLVEKEEELKRLYGAKIIVTGIAGNSKGTLINKNGLDLPAVLNSVQNSNIFESSLYPLKINTFEMLTGSGADVAIELSPLAIESGQPAIDHIKAAFDNNMHVITANKGPIAWAFDDLKHVAKAAGKRFLYETTVMDGTPIFNLAKYTMRGNKVLSFEGILNTTTNFILAELEKGNSYDDAVKEAQRRGFAEADPTMDITGMDAAAKTCALINALMGGEQNPTMIQTQGIQNVSADDLQKAKESGSTVKLICSAVREGGLIRGSVAPRAIPLTHPFATVHGTSAVLSIETDLLGKLTLIQHDPEIEQTAYGIYSDMLQLV